MAMAMLFVTMIAPSARAGGGVKPLLILDSEIHRQGHTLAVSAIDFTGTKLDADWSETQHGVELSVFLARGRLAEPDPDGLIPSREVYRGPLRITVQRASGGAAHEVLLGEPNSPMSAQRRRIYRTHLDFSLAAGDRIEIAAVPGWIDEPSSFTIPARGTRASLGEALQYFALSLFGFSGLFSLALLPSRS
jgi:hypothetical protein